MAKRIKTANSEEDRGCAKHDIGKIVKKKKDNCNTWKRRIQGDVTAIVVILLLVS